jgi:hypothetical protein
MTGRHRQPALQMLGACVLWLLVAATTPAWADNGPAWNSLSPSQQQHLAPLRRDWATIDPARRQKWLAMAERLEKLPPAERQRIQQRMVDWARLPDGARTQARQQFQETRQLSLDERQARWLEYQALPPEQRHELASQAKQRQRAGRDHLEPADTALRGGLQSKGNVLPLLDSRRGKVVAPAVVQARPGATTNPVSKSPQPAAFQQPGLPKIAATPDFVDPTTLLPRRGAQAAATLDKKPVDPARKPAQ